MAPHGLPIPVSRGTHSLGTDDEQPRTVARGDPDEHPVGSQPFAEIVRGEG